MQLPKIHQSASTTDSLRNAWPLKHSLRSPIPHTPITGGGGSNRAIPPSITSYQYTFTRFLLSPPPAFYQQFAITAQWPTAQWQGAVHQPAPLRPPRRSSLDSPNRRLGRPRINTRSIYRPKHTSQTRVKRTWRPAGGGALGGRAEFRSGSPCLIGAAAAVARGSGRSEPPATGEQRVRACSSATLMVSSECD